MKLTARRVTQNSTVFYETAIGAETLVDEDAFHPDRWNTMDNSGYQREINEPHARRIASYLGNEEGDNVLPTSLIINYRTPLVVRDLEDEMVELDIRPGLIGYIVDGQHRLAAANRAIEEGTDLSKYEFGVTITQFTLAEEMSHFRNINTSANRPPKGLGQVINARLSEEFGRPTANVTDQATNRVVALVSRLSSDSESPWYGKVAMGGLRKRSFNTIVQSALVKAFLPLFTAGRFYDPAERPEHIYQIVLNYWKAVEHVWPTAVANEQNSIILRANGAEPLIIILSRILTLKVNPSYADMVDLLSSVRLNTGTTDADWARDKGKIMDKRYGYSLSIGHKLIADFLWTGVDSRIKSTVGAD